MCVAIFPERIPSCVHSHWGAPCMVKAQKSRVSDCKTCRGSLAAARLVDHVGEYDRVFWDALWHSENSDGKENCSRRYRMLRFVCCFEQKWVNGREQKMRWDVRYECKSMAIKKMAWNVSSKSALFGSCESIVSFSTCRLGFSLPTLGTGSSYLSWLIIWWALHWTGLGNVQNHEEMMEGMIWYDIL